MQVSPEWLINPALQHVMKTLEDAGFEAFTVGGCVRDAVARRPCNDVDVATNAKPDQVKEVLKAAGCKLYPTGVEHGTWTVGKGKDTFEVTTYRRDVATDGRRATVEFADTMSQDAELRDFTMNALYMDRHGNVFDPTGEGLMDLLYGYVRFVGDAYERVREDYLRMLRLFRFHARFGQGSLGQAEFDAVSDMRNLRGLMSVVSGERVWSELKKILAVTEPQHVLAEMEDAGVLSALFGKTPVNVKAVRDVVRLERKYSVRPDWRRRYFALVGKYLPWPCAKDETTYFEKAFTARADTFNSVEAKAHLYGAAPTQTAEMVMHQFFPLGKLELWEKAKPPFSAQDFMDRGFEPGKALGTAMKEAKSRWLESSLRADKESCMKGLTP